MAKGKTSSTPVTAERLKQVLMQNITDIQEGELDVNEANAVSRSVQGITGIVKLELGFLKQAGKQPTATQKKFLN